MRFFTCLSSSDNIVAVDPCRSKRTQVLAARSLSPNIEQPWCLRMARSFPTVNLLIAVTVLGAAINYQSTTAVVAVDNFHHFSC